MLNKKKLRELAYVVKINDIKPIEGKDRVECAVVGGWTVMVRKGELSVGDYAVYFEIDSKVPATAPFEFLAAKHYKVKTQKYKTPNGVFFSQGLVMPFKDFIVDEVTPDWLIQLEQMDAAGKDINHYFLTDILGVTYSSLEDRKRKGNQSSPLMSFKTRHPKISSNKLVHHLLKREFCQKIILQIFRKRNESRAFPTGKFPGVAVTDQERCLPGATKILTESGWIQINKIVNQRLPVKIASMDSDGTISFKKILDYQKFKNDKTMVTIKYPYKKGVVRTGSLCCTCDHKIFTQRGYVEAENLQKTDRVYTPVRAYSQDSLAPLYGMLLGDSHIYQDKRNRGLLRLVATNGEVQLDYLKYKKSLFEKSEGKIVNAGLGTFSSHPSYHWFMNVDPYIDENIRKDWYSEGKKKISKQVIEKINEISLAFWYMDDGCLSYSSNSKTSYFIRLNTQGFSLEENELLCEMLQEKFHIKSFVSNDKTAKDGHQMYHLSIFSTEEADKFLSYVSPYICDSMLYKLPMKYQKRELKELHYEKSERVMEIPILSIEEGQVKNKTWGKNFSIVYDLEIEDNHNFIADNIVVHNCENMTWVLQDKTPYIVTQKCDGSSATYILERKPFGRFKFWVCSRRVNLSRDDPSYHGHNYYWDAADIYNIKDKMKDYLKKHPKASFVCWQGELCAPAIQGNPHKLSRTHLYLFHWTDSENGRLDIREAKKLWDNYQMETVPIEGITVLPDDFENFKLSADGYYNPIACEGAAKQKREGFVYYKTTDPTFSFKNVSRNYLLSKKE